MIKIVFSFVNLVNFVYEKGCIFFLYYLLIKLGSLVVYFVLYLRYNIY